MPWVWSPPLTGRLNKIFDPKSRWYEPTYELSVFDLDQIQAGNA
jgi:hypothetical protein